MYSPLTLTVILDSSSISGTVLPSSPNQYYLSSNSPIDIELDLEPLKPSDIILKSTLNICLSSDVSNPHKYLLNEVTTTNNIEIVDPFNFGTILYHGFRGAAKGAATFGIGYIGGTHGIFSKKIKTCINPFSHPGTKLSFLYGVPLTLFGESLTRLLLVSFPGSTIRGVLDLLLNFRGFSNES